MKTFRILAAVLTVAALSVIRPAEAQIFRKMYLNVDWQYNMPVGMDFADRSSGWGMHFEGGYYLLPEVSVGAFLSYHTNLSTLDRQTLQLAPGESLTTAQKHSVFQLPFGVTGRYTFCRDRRIEPYVGLELGSSYARLSSYYHVVKHYTDTWGFYLQPELGMNLFPEPTRRFGLHFALYYGYGTNDGTLLVYRLDGLSSFGFRAGVSF